MSIGFPLKVRVWQMKVVMEWNGMELCEWSACVLSRHVHPFYFSVKLCPLSVARSPILPTRRTQNTEDRTGKVNNKMRLLQFWSKFYLPNRKDLVDMKKGKNTFDPDLNANVLLTVEWMWTRVDFCVLWSFDISIPPFRHSPISHFFFISLLLIKFKYLI